MTELKGNIMPYSTFILSDECDLQKYRDFVVKHVIEAGLSFFMEREKSAPAGYNFLNTKFNPNTGKDLPPEGFDVVYTWLLGRGAEAIYTHLNYLDKLPGLSMEFKEQASSFLKRQGGQSTDAIMELFEKYSNHAPFRVDLLLNSPDAASARDDFFFPSDIFCAKGLLASGDSKKVTVGRTVLLTCIDALFDNRFFLSRAVPHDGRFSQGGMMLALGGIPHLIATSESDVARAEYQEVGLKLIDYVLQHHYDPDEKRFCEYVDRDGNRIDDYLDPGHALEFAGLGLQALSCCPAPASTAERIRNILDIAITSFTLGCNPQHGGIYKSVNNRTGKSIDSNMPWWNLPEAFRAGRRGEAVCENPEDKVALRRIATFSSNSYFTHYLNENMSLFPFQTRSGTTGEVVDVVPAVPEGDPLYHTNLAFIDGIFNL